MRQRLHGLDALRGLTLLSMIAYHTAWDLVYMFGVDWSWYRSPGAFVWQQSICWTFILLSGFCVRLGRHTLRRGVTVFLCGALITAVTVALMPGNRVFFGVLSLLGASMLLTAALQPYLDRIPPAFGLAASFTLFLLCYPVQQGVFGLGFSIRLPAWLYRNDFTACLGFPPHGFFSVDYFPLLPWAFLFWTGYFLSGLVRDPPRILVETRPPLLTAIGRRSLEIYLIHQPVIYALLTLLYSLHTRG